MFKQLEYTEILFKNSFLKFGRYVRNEDSISAVSFCLGTDQSHPNLLVVKNTKQLILRNTVFLLQ